MGIGSASSTATTICRRRHKAGRISTVMGYYIHRLKKAANLYAVTKSKAARTVFSLENVHLTGSSTEGSGASLKYQITPEDFSPSEYPLKVSVDLTYRIETNKLGVLFDFRNHEAELTAHVSFGLYPGFGATSFESFRLQMPRGSYRRHFAPGNFLSGQTRDIEFPGGEMPFPKTELPGAILLELMDVQRPQFSYVDPASGRWVMLDLTGVPYMTLWSDGGPFLCVEPCWGLPDHHDQRAFEHKEGLQIIPPGGELRCFLQHDSAACFSVISWTSWRVTTDLPF